MRITAVCSKCHRAYGWEGDLKGQTPACPHCGHQLPAGELEPGQRVLEAAGELATAIEKAEAAGPSPSDFERLQSAHAALKAELREVKHARNGALQQVEAVRLAAQIIAGELVWCSHCQQSVRLPHREDCRLGRAIAALANPAEPKEVSR